MADMDAISLALQKGKRKDIEELVKAALNEGVSPKDILEKGLIDGMGKIGERFKKNEIFVPEVLIAARAMHTAMAVLEPALVKAGVKPVGSIAIGTVKGDLHDIGKNLVAMMFKGAGFQVVDLGTDVPAEKFVAACKEQGCTLIGLSALLTTTMPAMKDVIVALKAAGLGDTVKVIIGGAPVTQAYSDEIGASGYSPDAASAVDLGKRLIGA